jgi:hypothetical protein
LELSLIISDKYDITAISKDGICEAQKFLMTVPAQYQASSDGIIELMTIISANGLSALSCKQSHYVSKEEKIWELIKGKLRVLYFVGIDNQIVVCVTGYIKHSQKCDEKLVKKAIRAKKAYFSAIEKNTLVVLKDDANEDE